MHDASARRISVGFGVLSDIDDVCKLLKAIVRNDGDHTSGPATEPMGVYMDVIPPGGPGDPFGCLPNGRVIETTFDSKANHAISAVDGTLDGTFQKEGVVIKGFLSFSCGNQTDAVGKKYTIITVVDIHGDDLASCGPGALLTQICANALADDDPVTGDNLVTRSAPRVAPVPE